jgi:hypothetical protein
MLHPVEPVHDLEARGRELLAVGLRDLVTVLNALQQRRAPGQHDRRQQPHAHRAVEEVEHPLAEAVMRQRWRRRRRWRILRVQASAHLVAQLLLGFDDLALLVRQHVRSFRAVFCNKPIKIASAV